MRIYTKNTEYMSSYRALKPRQLKTVAQKTRSAMNNFDKKAGFMSTPIKYYAIGLALPIPFASTFGLIIGLGVATYKKFFSSQNKKTS